MLELTLSILYHAALGIALAGLVWTVGGGCIVLLRSRLTLPAVFAYPAGLLVVLAACTLFLTERWLGIISLALVISPLIGVWRRRDRASPVVRRAARAVGWAGPAIVGLASTLGFFLHGPTSRVDSNAFGDVVWYVAKMASARQSLFPLRDLSAAGVDLSWLQFGPSLIGATASYLPGFDPFLFETSALPAFLAASLCFGFVLLPLPDSTPRLRFSLLSVAMVAYASWLAESPPVTLALPLAFSVYVLAVGGRPPKRAFTFMLAILALNVVLTKGLLLVPLAILAGFAGRGYDFGPRKRLVLVIGAPLALLAASLANSWWVVKAASLHFQPVTVYRGLRAQLHTRSTIELAPALQLAGYLALGVLLVRARAKALLVALVVCVLWSWTILEYSIQIGLGLVVLLSVLELGRRAAGDRALLAAAAACFALGAWFRDFAGVRAALVEAACLAAVVMSALVPQGWIGRRRLVFHLRLYAGVGGVALLALSGHALAAGIGALALMGAFGLLRPPAAIASATAVACLLLGVASAIVAHRADDLRIGTYDTTILPSDEYMVWHRVGEVVPNDGLVFTDQTGASVAAATGQNYYPAIAGRQVYLAGWYLSRLREDDAERERRLRMNERVLDGKASPRAAADSGSFRSYYAVVANAGPHPPSFRRLYANERYALYRITG